MPTSSITERHPYSILFVLSNRSNPTSMDVSSFLKRYAEEINGQFTNYDSQQSILIVPVSGGRFQTIICTERKNELYNRKMMTFNSKVCSAKAEFDYRMLLEQVAFFNYCRFIVQDQYLQVEAVSALESLNEDTIKEMVQEVANLADQYELKLTGVDVH